MSGFRTLFSSHHSIKGLKDKTKVKARKTVFTFPNKILSPLHQKPSKRINKQQQTNNRTPFFYTFVVPLLTIITPIGPLYPPKIDVPTKCTYVIEMKYLFGFVFRFTTILYSSKHLAKNTLSQGETKETGRRGEKGTI